MSDSTNNMGSYGDDIYSGSFDDDFGLAIGAALGDLRVEPQDFADGVAERIEEGEEEIRKSGPGRVLNIGWLRQAASFMPPFLVPRALAEAGLTVGGVVVKKSAWKWLPGVLAIPAVVFSLMIASFVWGVRRTGGVQRQGVVEDLAGYQVRMWWKANRLASIVAPVLLFLLGRQAPLEAVTVYVILGIVVQLGIFRTLAGIGLASRAEIGQRCGEFLLTTVLWAYVFMTVWVPEGDGTAVRAGLVFLPILGAGVCLRLGSRDRLGWAMRHKQRVVLPVLGALIFGVSIVAFTGSVRAIRADAVDYVEQGFQDKPEFGGEIQEVAATYLHLSALEGDAPDATLFRQHLSGHLEDLRVLNPERDTDYRGVLECSVLGWLTPEQQSLFSDSARMQRLTRGASRMHATSDVYFDVQNRILAGNLSPLDNARITDPILAAARKEHGYGSLENLWCAVQVLDQLGSAEALRKLTPALESALRATWTESAGGDEGGFVRRPSEDASLSTASLTSTDYAVRLMARFGVPDVVDLELLAAYLNQQTERQRMSGQVGHSSLAAALHARVTEMIGPQEDLATRHSWNQLAELRVVLAVALLALFCIVLTARAPLTLMEEC